MGNCANCTAQQGSEQPRSNSPTPSSYDHVTRTLHRNILSSRLRSIRSLQPYNLNGLIDETLAIIRTVVDTDQDLPHAMLVVSRIASREDRWLEVMVTLVERIPINDPLGATVIALLLDECPLPSRELLQQLITRICADNRARIKLLQSVIDEYIRENNQRSQKRAISTANNRPRAVDVDEVTPMIAGSEGDQQSDEK